MTIHALVKRSVQDGKTWFTAECLEVAVVTQACTLDEVAGNLGEAIRLHHEGDAPGTRVAAASRITLIYEMAVPTS